MSTSKFTLTTRLLITSIIFTGLFSACEKDDYNTLQPAERNASKNSFKQASEDTANPNERLGKQHIYAVDEISSHSDFPLSISGEEVYTVTKEYLKDSLEASHFLDYEEIKNIYNGFVGDTIKNKSDYVQLSPEYFSGYLKEQTSLSSEAVQYVNELETAYENFQSVSELVDEIKAIEGDVVADADLKSEELEMLTGLLAIARNDLIYWDDIIHTSSHDWHEPFMEDLNSGEETDLMRNLSLSSACTYSLVFTQEFAAGYNIAAAHSAGVNQASFHPGPGTIVDIEL